MDALRSDWPGRVAFAAGLTVSALGVAVLFAWHLHFVPLIQVFPELAPMHRMTAAGFLLSGAALVFASIGRRRIASVLSLGLFILALVVSLEYVLGVDLGVDQLLGLDYIRVRTTSPGRSSPVSTVCFLFISVALLALTIRRFARYASAVAGVAASVLAAVGTVTVLAYLLGNTDAYGWGHFTRVSLHSGSSLLLLGIGLLVLAWRERPVWHGLPAWAPVSVALGLSAGVLGVWQAVMAQEGSDVPLISSIVLGGGLLLALLLALAVYQAQKARERNRELQEGKSAMERLFEASPDALLVTDRQGRITRVNHRVESILGYTRDALLGTQIESLISEEFRDPHRQHRESFYTSPTTRPMGQGLDLCALRKDGKHLPVDISFSPLQSGSELQVLAVVRDVSERKQAQEALRQSEERFRGIFETSPLGLALIDQDYRLAKVNPSLCRMSGYSEAELLAMNPLDLTHPDDREESVRLAERLFQGEIPFYQLEKRYQKKNGEIIWADMSATVLRDREGRPTYGLGMVQDITERKQEQEALRESEERFRSLFEQGPIGITLMGKDYRLFKVNAALSRMLGYSETELTTMTALDFTFPDDRGPTVNLTEQLFDAETPMRKMEKRYVKKNGEIIWGSVTASVIHDQQGRPLYGMGMIEDITERKRAEEELHSQTQRLSLATQSASMGVWEWNLRTERGMWDDTMFQILGVPKKASVGRADWEPLMHPDDRAKEVAFMEAIVHGSKHANLECRVIRPDGSLIHISAAGGPILDNRGELTGVVGVAVDITQRKEAEEKLHALSTRLSQAARFSSMGVWEFDPATSRCVLDDTAFPMIGIPKVGPMDFAEFARLIHPDDLPKVKSALETIVREKTQASVEFRVIRPDGVMRHAYTAGGAVLDQQGNVVRVLGTAFDITGRKRAEEELRALTQRLSLATKSSSMGVWDWNLRTDQAIWDDTMFEIFDMPKKASVSREDWTRRIHAGDVAKVEAFLETIVRGKTQDSVEFRIIRRDGSVRHVSATGGVVLDDHRAVTGVVGITVEITARKRTEEELHTLSERLSLATQIASIGVWDWDLRTNLEVWDDAAFEMFGMPKGNPMRHGDFMRHVHPDDRSKLREAVERVIQGKAQDSVEFRIIREDGSSRHLSGAGGAVLDEHGDVVRMVGIAIDITGRKQMEAKLEASREQMVASARLSALGMMAGGIAHEINNPLSIIHAMASDLNETVDESGSVPPKVVARKSGIIRETAERIAKIVKSLRQISREGAADPPHPTRLAKILDEALEICRAKFEANGVTLLLPQTIPQLTVPCREVQIEQALLNLLQNAFDAAVEKEGNRWVKIEVTTHDDSVAISVIDSGPGIPPELRSRIMEPFFTTKEVGKGTGLGLSLSKTIAEEHGGKLEYGEDHGHTRFSLVLPLSAQAEAA